jgi:ATP-binding cassette subfamily B protein
VGPTGAGKTSLVECLPRLVEVPEGAVFVDGRDVTGVPLSDLRAAFGYAPQDAWLLSDTLRENLRWGLPQGEGERLSEAEVEARIQAAVKHSGLEPDLAALPHGLDTVVGERGVLLSGGQRQRVCLARALVGSAPVLLLDDCLSAVDVQVERRILRALREQLRDRTLLLVTHRPTALADMDNIVVLDGGRVVESGRHEALLRAGGRYAALYRDQQRAEAWEAAGERPLGDGSARDGSARDGSARDGSARDDPGSRDGKGGRR